MYTWCILCAKDWVYGSFLWGFRLLGAVIFECNGEPSYKLGLFFQKIKNEAVTMSFSLEGVGRNLLLNKGVWVSQVFVWQSISCFVFESGSLVSYFFHFGSAVLLLYIYLGLRGLSKVYES